MEQDAIFLTILGMAFVTYLPRAAPLLLLSSRSLPAPFMAWLHFVPVAILSALVAPSLLLTDGRFSFGFQNLYLWAAMPTIFTAWKTRSLFAALMVGMTLVALARLLLAV
jgi:branched-subunit amino acid transport protein